MGRYDGILIMSDWDGTLSTGGTVSAENIEAIRRFQAEGGIFTLCSGRNYTHFDRYREFVVPNAPICAYNGALIVDTDGSFLSESFLDREALLAVRELVIRGAVTSYVNLYTKEDGAPTTCTMQEFVDNFAEYEKMHHYKSVLVCKKEEEAIAAQRLAETLIPDGCFAVRSWPVGLEILKKSASKGEALKFMKKRLGARLTVAAGDYENDAEMLVSADIGYAVENAVPSVKAVADRITVSASESAIARIIDEL